MRYLSKLLMLSFFLVQGYAQPVMTLWISPDGYHSDHNHGEMQAYPCNSSYYIFYSTDPGIVPMTIKNEGDETLIISSIITQSIQGASFTTDLTYPQEVVPGHEVEINVQYQLPADYINGVNGSLSILSNDPVASNCSLNFDVGCAAADTWTISEGTYKGLQGDCFAPLVWIEEIGGDPTGPIVIFNDSMVFYAYDRVNGQDSLVKAMWMLQEGVIFPKAILAGLDLVNNQHVFQAGYNPFGESFIDLNGNTDIDGNVTIRRNVGIDSSLYVEGLLNVKAMFNESDERIKRDISPLSQGLSKIMALQPYSYFLRDSTIQTTRQYGFTAQDIEDVLPDLVRTNNQDYKSVNYVQLIPWLTAALQEQQKEIEDLRKQLEVQDELQNRILILEQKLDK